MTTSEKKKQNEFSLKEKLEKGVENMLWDGTWYEKWVCGWEAIGA